MGFAHYYRSSIRDFSFLCTGSFNGLCDVTNWFTFYRKTILLFQKDNFTWKTLKLRETLHILLLATNSYVLSSVVPKAFKNRNPGLKSLHKFIYARVRIKTSDGCCKREWEWSGPADLFTNNAPTSHPVDCLGWMGNVIVNRSSKCNWILTVFRIFWRFQRICWR